MAGGGGQQGAAAPAQGQMGQGAAQPQGGGMPQQQPQINPQTIQDVQNLIQQYQSGQLGDAQRGFAFGGPTNTGAPTPGGPYGGFNPTAQPQNNLMRPAIMPIAQPQPQPPNNLMRPAIMPIAQPPQSMPNTRDPRATLAGFKNRQDGLPRVMGNPNATQIRPMPPTGRR